MGRNISAMNSFEGGWCPFVIQINYLSYFLLYWSLSAPWVKTSIFSKYKRAEACIKIFGVL
jgi:hypothetical protein